MHQRKVLIIDDDEAIVALVRGKLDTADVRSDAADSAEEALTLMRSNLYAVAVVDIHLPGMSGTELISEFKRINPLVQIIMLTGDSRSGLVMESIARGAIDFVVKNGDLTPLVRAVCAAFERARHWEFIFSGQASDEPAEARV